MNINKTNKLGVLIAQKGFIGGNRKMCDMVEKSKSEPKDENLISLNARLLKHNPKQKVIRVSKSIIDACKLIDIASIKENINQSNFNFRSMIILLDNDKSGLIKVERYGSDIWFMLLSGLSIYGNEYIGSCYNSYSFLSKSFSFDKDDNRIIDIHNHNFNNYDKSVFVIKLLTYLIFGDITEKHLAPKKSANMNATRFLNNSKLNITFCDSLWKQRINTDGFKVRGHFRLQPVGEGRKDRKLIWIEEFEKKGYNRKATVELIK